MYRSKWAAFTKFLEIAREQAVKSNVLLATCEQKEVETFKCRICGGPGHKAAKCPVGAVRTGHAGSASVTTVADDASAKQEREKKARTEAGRCQGFQV